MAKDGSCEMLTATKFSCHILPGGDGAGGICGFLARNLKVLLCYDSQQNIGEAMRNGWKLAIGFAIGGMLTALILHPPLTSQDWAAWVQALGSFAAVAIAIWIPYSIHREAVESQKKLRYDEQRAIARSILTEVKVLSYGFQKSVGYAIERASDELISVTADSYLPPDKPFSVYDGCVARISDIADVRIREQIIITYASMNGLLTALRKNKEIRRLMDKAGSDYMQSDSHLANARYNAAKQACYDSGQDILNRYQQAKINIRRLNRLAQIADIFSD